MVEPSASSTLLFDLSTPRRLHVVGIGGSGMRAIAEVLVGMGHQVSGSDRQASPALDRLARLGVEVHVGHSAAHVEGAAVPDAPALDAVPLDAVVVSTAIDSENPEVVAARQRGLPVLRRAEVLSAICGCRRTIAVAGTHGKTTTSAMLAHVLLATGRRPSFVVGGELHDLGTGARWDEGEWLVVEADESDGTFLELPAEVAVVTSVEPDHLEHWGGFEPLVVAFDRFLGAAAIRVVCADDECATDLGRRHGAVLYGFAEGADERIVDYLGGREGCRFTVENRRGPASATGAAATVVDLATPGRHNAANATAALTVAAAVGVPFEEAAAALSGYGGVARRFHVRGERGGVTFVDEYAHLPGEVRASLAAAADGGWRRVVCVFQPHRYSRTAGLWRDFAHAFDAADVLAVTDVYPAGEPPRPGVTGKLIVDAVLEATSHRRVAWLPSREGLLAFLRRELRPGDLCLTLGAGDLTTVPDEFLGDSRA